MSTYMLPFIAAPIPEAAKSVGVSESLLRRAVARGDITAHHVGDRASKPVLLAEDLISWLKTLPTERGKSRA